MLNKFFEKTHLGIVWLVSYIVILVLWMILPYLLGGIEGKYYIPYFKLGLVMSALMGSLVTLLTYSMRKNVEFWAEIKIIRTKVENTESLSEIQELHKELDIMKTKVGGHYGFAEIGVLRTILNTKQKYIK